MKLTPIFPPHIKPVHKGVYKTGRLARNMLFWSYWDGERWGRFVEFYDSAKATAYPAWANQNKRWQGVEK